MKRRNMPIQLFAYGAGILISLTIVIVALSQPNPFPGHLWQKIQASGAFGTCPQGTIKGYTWFPVGVKEGEILEGQKISSLWTKSSRINCYKMV